MEHIYAKIKNRTSLFYEILSIIKAYQSETVSQLSPSCCTPGCFFTKGPFLIFSSSYHVYIHTKCSGFTDWMVCRAL